MTDKKYKYIEGKIKEQPSMKEPDATKILGANPSGADHEVLDELTEEYEKQKANCKEYTVVGSIPPDWKTGRDIDPKEFRLKEQVFLPKIDRWTDSDNLSNLYQPKINKMYPKRRTIAIPIQEVAKQKEETVLKSDVESLLHTILNCEREIYRMGGLREIVVSVHDIRRIFDEFFNIKEKAPF